MLRPLWHHLDDVDPGYARARAAFQLILAVALAETILLALTSWWPGAEAVMVAVLGQDAWTAVVPFWTRFGPWLPDLTQLWPHDMVFAAAPAMFLTIALMPAPTPRLPWLYPLAVLIYGVMLTAGTLVPGEGWPFLVAAPMVAGLGAAGLALGPVGNLLGVFGFVFFSMAAQFPGDVHSLPGRLTAFALIAGLLAIIRFWLLRPPRQPDTHRIRRHFWYLLARQLDRNDPDAAMELAQWAPRLRAELTREGTPDQENLLWALLALRTAVTTLAAARRQLLQAPPPERRPGVYVFDAACTAAADTLRACAEQADDSEPRARLEALREALGALIARHPTPDITTLSLEQKRHALDRERALYVLDRVRRLLASEEVRP